MPDDGKNDNNDNKKKIRWDDLTPSARQSLVWNLWLITWIDLLYGYVDARGWPLLCLFSAIHAGFFGLLFGGDMQAFPVQVRIAYFLWVAAGTYIPGMTVLMWITTVGLATNLFVGYCPLARMMTLCPWNRTEAISMDLLKRTFLSPPTTGKFQPPPTSSSASAGADKKKKEL